MNNSKVLILAIFMLLCIGIVGATNYQYIYNPYTGKLDRSISLNQTGNNITADYFTGTMLGSLAWTSVTGRPTHLTNFTDDIDYTVKNVNSSDYWDNLDVPSDLNDKITIQGENISGGTVADARIASTIARDSEVVSANTSMKSYVDIQDTALDNKIDSIGNWSADSGTYQIWTTTKSYIDSVGNWTLDKASYYTSAIIDTLGNWSADKGDYSTTTEAGNLYAPINYGDDWNKTYADTLYSLITEPIASSLGNWSLDKASYYLSSQVDTIISSIGNWSNDKGTYSLTTAITGWIDANYTAANTYTDTQNTSMTSYVDGTFINKAGDTTGALTSDLNIDANSLVVSYDDNNVGIGTTTPGSKLTVSSGNISIDVSNKLRFAGASDASWNIGADLSAIGGQAALRVKAYGAPGNPRYISLASTNGSTILDRLVVNTESGNVGIGTTSPNATLHINHPAQTSSSYDAKGLLIAESVSPYRGIVAFSRSAEEGYIGLNSDQSASSGYFILGMNLDSAANRVDALTAREDGKIGIGTTSPLSLFHTVGDYITIGNDMYQTEAEMIRFARTDSPSIRYHSITGETNSGAADTYLKFKLHNGTTNTTEQKEVMVLRGNGNVGIGSTAPNQKLQVAGNINATGNISIGVGYIKDNGTHLIIGR